MRGLYIVFLCVYAILFGRLRSKGGKNLNGKKISFFSGVATFPRINDC